MILCEFTGTKHAGQFRYKPAWKVGVGKSCKLCGSTSHLGKTTCPVIPLTRNPDGTIKGK